jgi:DNA-binding MarR family transcriptional regulator
MLSVDPLVANPGRLKILLSLAAAPEQEFVELRKRTRLTDGNLATHARRLHVAGFIQIDKQFRAGKPITCYQLTTEGRAALEAHVRDLVAAMEAPAPHLEAPRMTDEDDDEWID